MSATYPQGRTVSCRTSVGGQEAAAAREQADAADLSVPGAGGAGGQLPGAGTGRETTAVILLRTGWVIAGAGWLIGLVLAWTSPRWSTAEKLGAAFLAVPVLAALVLARIAVPDHVRCSMSSRRRAVGVA
jgi:hypothetical protein